MAMAGGGESGSASCPRTLHVVGRCADRVNGDICGEYAHAGVSHGFAVYQQLGSATVIRHSPSVHRWVIDREGMRESDVCVAFADDLAGSVHPACADLLWHVWDPATNSHVVDSSVVAFTAPTNVTLVGRAANRENFSANGEYALVGVANSRPLYKHKGGNAMLRFHAEEGRWLLSSIHDSGNSCCAFAEGTSAEHPGTSELQWQFWEPQLGSFVADPATRTIAAPRLLHVLGQGTESGKARVCGTYHLAGAWETYPLYVRPGTQTVIRYSRKTDRWLIDCEGLVEPSLMNRLCHWILTGDTSAATERCTAYAQACGAQHPGLSDLQWQIWDSRTGRHDKDVNVRATTAPLVLRISGRASTTENNDINGDYVLQTTHLGRPAYQKVGARAAIRFWPPSGRWVIDREGLRNTDSCVAYAECARIDHPATDDATWYVYETNRGQHCIDRSVVASVPADVPLDVSSPALAVGKRGPALPQPEYKRRRLDVAHPVGMPVLQHDDSSNWCSPRMLGGA